MGRKSREMWTGSKSSSCPQDEAIPSIPGPAHRWGTGSGSSCPLYNPESTKQNIINIISLPQYPQPQNGKGLYNHGKKPARLKPVQRSEQHPTVKGMSVTEEGGLSCCHGYPCGCMCLLLFSSILLSNYGFLYWALKSSKILRTEPKVMATINHPAQPRGNPGYDSLVTMVKRNAKICTRICFLALPHLTSGPKEQFQDYCCMVPQNGAASLRTCFLSGLEDEWKEPVAW